METFIQKYQPKVLKNFDLSTDVYNFIKNLIDIDNLNIVFSGDSDSGKTTLLNCLIKEYYEGYDKKDYEKNIIKLNSAKEQGIHFYRNEVKTFCQTCSIIKNKKKIVIIDDLDLINDQSQQVFRNCIDNYYNNVHFICSCTNLKKIIESIQSRLIILKIPNVTQDKLMTICRHIMMKENINIDEECLPYFVNYCENSLRIMINYLEKFKLYNETINFESINLLCTNISDNYFDNLITLIKEKNLNDSIDILMDIYNQGYSVMDILDCFFVYVKSCNKLSEKQKYDIIPYICKFIQIFHEIHENPIELPIFINNIIKLI